MYTIQCTIISVLQSLLHFMISLEFLYNLELILPLDLFIWFSSSFVIFYMIFHPSLPNIKIINRFPKHYCNQLFIVVQRQYVL